MAMATTTKPRVSKIVGIQFSILSPEEIRKGAVTEITSRDTYIGNKPVLGGLFCPYMGVSEPGMLCPTDGLDYMQTPGYFGYIELAMPVFYYQHLNTIHKILRCVCLKCSRLLINKDMHKQALKLSPDERWSYVFGVASKVKRCGDENEEGCGCLMPKKIKKENLATLIAEWDSDGVKGMSEEDAKKMNMQLTPDIVLKIFRRISDDDVSFMGFSPTFSRPDWMICQVLAVPPPAVRPSIKMDGQQRSEDDLTHIIVNIVKANKTLQEKIRDGAQASVWHMVLQYYCATLVDNNIPGAAPVAQRSGRKLKSIKERLNGKGGRVRGNLMGKRVDFSARSVITPDPNLSIRELGVPLKIAKNITKPVVVNDMNRRFLTKLVRNGPEEYPGAKILERKGGESISLRYADRENIVLYNGDIVHRHIMDGDGVLFNRQPTLHRMSMMCHIARIMRQGDTFRMNVGDTKPYNADFDGDEMNMHMPQDEEAEAELKNLAAVPYQIISPAKNQSIIGIFQDSLVGSYRFTRPNISFTPREAMNLLMAYNGINEGLFATQAERITSFQILSQIMPAFTMKYKTKGFGENDDFATSPGVLEIVDGKYLRGQLDKDVLGGGSNGLITRTCNDFGNMAAAAFIDDLQNIVTEYMKSSAYSVGISDLIADRSTNEQITQSITAKKKEVKNLIDQTYLGIFENATGNTNEDEFEFQVTNILNKATNDSGKIGLKSLSKDNRFVTMVKSGSKGSDLNISQMIACLGQQLIDGKRIPYGFENRTLPHFTKYDDSPGARGFVENSFISGLTPEELFFHAMGGRVGLIDTAVKSVTWETPVVVVENDEPKYVKIGEWIDSHISSSSTVQRMTEQNMEYLELDHPVKIVTMDYDGHVSWETVSAVTRHDPGEKLYKITTHAGRYVTVTANKSLLVWNAELGEFREKYTDEIKVGDFVPVAKHVRDLRSGVGIDEIQMTKYFPKNEFIYGSEVKTAIEMMNESMQDRKKIPSNWWDENNNTAFTLPFDSKARLQRAIVRSKIDELSANGVYPPSGSRQWGIIPETFELNFENGTFIGLFIAEGNINGANIYITNNDSNIREFVKTWFAKYNIKCKEDIRKNNANGTTSTVVGTSCILAKFITQLVGHGADSKHVPNEAYVSNIEFVKGIISGYISGDGHVSRNSIESSSCSQRLTEDIAFLCSRIGVHARVFKSQLKRNNLGTKNIKPCYRLSIRSTNGQLFADQIDLLHDQKNDRLKSIRWTSALNKVHEHNDVVLDAIVSIEFVDPALHPKMYDLTIPTTLNFGLANGLQVRDTSSTGYIQRRLIKGMEDLKIEYDMTVRNNKGRVIQFSYGEDGIDPVKVESQIVPLVNMGLDEIYAHYHMPSSDPKDVVFTAAFTKGVISRMKKQKAENDAKCKQWIDFMIEQREKVIQRVFRSKNNDRVYLPVAFAHTINNVKGLQQINNNSIVDITPLEAFAMIEAAYKRLETMHYCAPTQLFKVMYFYYLSPKDLLMVKRFNKKALTVLLEMIVLKYKNSLIAPGEMVGMISAQSIGEPTTQLTLNSVSYDTRIMLKVDGQIKVYQIGEYIDQYIEKAERMEDHPNDTKLGYINADEDVFVPSVDAFGITSWKRVEAVTRHPVVNADGTNTVLRVTTEDGRQVIATKAKSFLSIDAKNQLAATNGSDLKVGDYIPINQRAFEMPENDSTRAYLVQHAERYSNLKNMSEVNDVIPTFVHNGKVHTNMNRKKLAAIIGTNPFPDVRFDKIVSIEEIPNPTEWMYDFTVEETRTFIIENGMAVYDTFHTAGSGVAMKANVTRGVPRIEELLSITENPKNSSLTICLKKDEETDCERAKELIAQIELTQLSELVESVSICFDPDDLNTLIQEDRSTLLQYYEYQRLLQECAGIDVQEADDESKDSARSKWIIRMVMSREAMLDKRITMDDVHFAIKNSHGDDVSCIYADYNADKLVFRLRMNNINGKKPLKPKENPLDQSDKIYLLKAFQDQLLNNIVLRGLKNISKVTLRKLMDTLHKEDGAYVKKETWVLDTKGTNLMDVLALDYINVNRTISDDIQEIRSVLGIEAAREALLAEMTGVFENDGTYINYHHLSLLCDRMTASASMVSIFRHGINNDNIGPIAKASFEETPEMFLKAARHAELDQMRGISANVMCGQEGYYGTSSFQVMLDLPQMIAKMEDVAFQAQNEQAEIAEAMGSAAADTSACAFENLTIESNVGSIQKVDLGHGADNYNVGF
jgi:DNA-directed RNA polymerase beta' subunit